MKQLSSQILYNYWNEVRGDRLAPARFDIEPSKLAPILSETFILERTAPKGYVFRLAGTRICEQFGQELRGRDFTWLGGGERRTILKTMDTVTDDCGVAVFEFEAATATGSAVSFEVVVLPLVHPANTVTRYLGTVSPLEYPAWLGAEPLSPTAVIASDIVWPDGQPAPQTCIPDRQPPFSAALAAARIVRVDRRQFRILDGGRKE